MVERYADMIAGYLLALQRMSGSGSKFTANCFAIEGDIDLSIQKHISTWGVEATYAGKTKLTQEEIQGFLNQCIYAELLTATENQVKFFEWDIQEFFGLMSKEINPLSKGGYNLNIKAKGCLELQALLVEVENYGVILVVSKNA